MKSIAPQLASTGERTAAVMKQIYGGAAWGLLGLALMISSARTVCAQAEQDRPVAWVDNHVIFQSEVEAEVEQVTRARTVEGTALDILRAQALEQLISQAIVLDYLRQNDLAASETDRRLEIERLKEQLERVGESLDDYLADKGLTEDQFNRMLDWRMSWSRYLGRYLTEENLAQYFADHRMEFDGTRLHAWQVFIRVDESSTAAERTAALERAGQWRAEIVAEQTTFTDVARQHSDSPSGAEGGDLGWVSRTGDLPESVLKVLFSLECDEVSEPIESSYGVHLLRWTEDQPGQVTWEEAGSRLEKAATEFLFDWVVSEHRESLTIRYEPSYPHFEPGTKTLADSQ